MQSILIVNPNTTISMTDGLKPLITSLNYNSTKFTYFTAPSGVPSINNEIDATTSATHCLPALKRHLRTHDACLVCCYSQHPLVPLLRHELILLGLHKPVLGIFEASVTSCLQSLDIHETFGIVSTGESWKPALDSAVAQFLGADSSTRYEGTETTGLNANELHSTEQVEVDRRMKDATKRLLSRGVKAICLGCAGMAGLETVVREACVEMLGREEGQRIKVVDGVVAGVVFLEGALRAKL